MGISQWAIAKARGYSSAQYISNLERSLASVSIKEAKWFCVYLDIPKKKFIKAYDRDLVRSYILRMRELKRKLSA